MFLFKLSKQKKQKVFKRSKSLKEAFDEKRVEESEFARVKRLYQKLFRSFYKNHDHDHHFKLKLYQHASEH